MNPTKIEAQMKPLAFYCDRKYECKWQCFMLGHGLAWGEIPSPLDPWRKAHSRECGGNLIQIYEYPDRPTSH